MIREYVAALKAAADPSRARILKLLQSAELCVCQLRVVLGLSQSTVSGHLAVLRDAGFVESRTRGRWTFYRLAGSARNCYTAAVGALIREWLDDDHTVRSDRERLKQVLQADAERVCRGGEKRS